MIQGLDWIQKRTGLDPAANSEALTFVQTASSTMCMQCRGNRMLCGKAYCPILSKADLLVKHLPKLSKEEIDGSSPPGAFVGRVGYPKVYVGPLIPPEKGDTRVLDTPELWMGKSIQAIIDYRFRLIRGKSLIEVHDAQDPGRYLLDLHDLALSSTSVEVNAKFKKKPRMSVTLSEETQPFGPSALIQNLEIVPSAGEQKLEAVYYDSDLLASNGMVELYRDGIEISRIQKTLSLGMLGIQDHRKIVPTRWSITAVDDTLSKHLLQKIRNYQTLDKIQVYKFEYLDNWYAAILSPRNWAFEWIEAWFPGTAWNETGSVPALMGDHEPFEGRTTYASVGGCYYSTRLAVAEALERMRKQASALVLREIRPGYVLPVGVWNVRESVRATLRTQPTTFDDFQHALAYACKEFKIKPDVWIRNSHLIREEMFQTRLSQYFRI
ncbi:MAG: Nre family DNA repair protein [Candidatus Bathyarchaeia archaeon]